MPFAKIHVIEGRYDEARLDRVSNAIQQTLRAELGTSPDELFHIIHLLQPAHAVLPRTELLGRSDLVGAYAHHRPPCEGQAARPFEGIERQNCRCRSNFS
jgi:hypothetical protein